MGQFNKAIFTSAATNADISSLIIWAEDLYRFSIQAVFTGTPTGTLQLQVSNDFATNGNPQSFTPAKWTNLGSAVTTNAAGIYMIPSATAVESAYEYIKLLYSDASSGASTAVMSARIKAITF